MWKIAQEKSVIYVFGLILLFAVSCSEADLPTEVNIDLSIENRTINFDSSIIKVKHQDTGILNIVSDERGVLHIHGYDLKVDVMPRGESLLTIPWHATGKFPIAFHAAGQNDKNNKEGHDAHQEEGHAAHSESEEIILGWVEVHPR